MELALQIILMPFRALIHFYNEGVVENAGPIMLTLSVLFLILGLIAKLILFIVSMEKDRKKIALMTPAEKQNYLHDKKYGKLNVEMICPHCQTKGLVYTKSVTLKKGVSGAKATGALLTAGLSLFATGLSREEHSTKAHCDKCNSTWFF